MDLLNGIILGVLQGLTEFLPVSSSGHLTIGGALLSFDHQSFPLFFTVWVHAATLLAVLLYYRRDLWDLALLVFAGKKPETAGGGANALNDGAASPADWTLFIGLAIGTIPAVITGLSLGEWIDAKLATPKIASCMLIVTAGVLLLTLLEKPEKRPLTWGLALAIGCAQALALPPGISRSGMTIAAAILLGVSRAEAVRFSFLLSIPAIGGALILMLLQGGVPASLGAGVLATSAIAAFAAGYAAIWLVQRFVVAGRFHYFSFYCLALAAFGLIYF